MYPFILANNYHSIFKTSSGTMWAETPAQVGPSVTTQVLKTKRRKRRRKPWNLRTTIDVAGNIKLGNTTLSPPYPRPRPQILSLPFSHFLPLPHLLLSLSTTKQRKRKRKQKKRKRVSYATNMGMWLHFLDEVLNFLIHQGY